MPEGNEGQQDDDRGAEGTEDKPGTGSGTGTDDTGQDDAKGKPNGNKPADGDGGKGDGGDDWKARSRTWEGRAKEHKTAAEQAAAERDEARATLDALRKLVDPNAKPDEDPKDAAQKLLTRAEQAEAKLRARDIRDALITAGRKAGADTDLLVDSKAVLDKAADLDPDDKAFAEDVEALVKQALKERPSLKAATAPPAKSGNADMTGAGGGSGATTKSGKSRIDEIRKEKYGR